MNFDKFSEETKIVNDTISELQLTSPTQLHHPYISYQSDTHRDTPALPDTMLTSVRKWSREWGRDNNCQATVGIWKMSQLQLSQPNLVSWFSVCNLILTQLEEIWRTKLGSPDLPPSLGMMQFEPNNKNFKAVPSNEGSRPYHFYISRLKVQKLNIDFFFTIL